MPAPGTWTLLTGMLADRSSPVGKRARDPSFTVAWVLGGQTNSASPHDSSDNHMIDLETDTWTVKASMPAARSRLWGIAHTNGKVYYGGGNGGLTETKEYDPLANTYASKTASSATKERSTAVEGSDGLIYVFGNQTLARGTTENDAYDPVGNAWTAKAAMPTTRMAADATYKDDYLWIGGGNYTVPQVFPQFLDRYDVLANTWSTRSGPSPYTTQDREGATVPDDPDPVSVWFGDAASAKGDAYDDDLDAWVTWGPVSVSPESRGGALAFGYRGQFHILGGSHGGIFETDHWMYQWVEDIVEVPVVEDVFGSAMASDDLDGFPGHVILGDVDGILL